MAIDPAFRYLGLRVVELGGAVAAIDGLVGAVDDSTLERFYWIRFEGRRPGNPGRYDDSDMSHADKISMEALSWSGTALRERRESQNLPVRAEFSHIQRPVTRQLPPSPGSL